MDATGLQQRSILIQLTPALSCLWVTVLIVALSGCRSPEPYADRGYVDMELQMRTGAGMATESCPGELMIPPGVILEDGITESEAVALALWNNRNFLATLSNLGIARGDLVQAGLLSNPQLNLLFPPIGSKQLEWTLYMPLEALILRKQRIEIAERDFQRICQELVQNGLDVARDARVALANLRFAIDRATIAQESVKVRTDIANLAEKRLNAGDISELEAFNTRIDANRAAAEAAGLDRAVQAAEATLRNVLGLAAMDVPLVPVDDEPVSVPEWNVDSLVLEAIAIRPDVKAARFSVDAAQHRVSLARKSFLRIDAVADGNAKGAGPTNAGPGLRFEIPIFNRNQGLIIRSQWSVDQANHNFYGVRDRAVTEVRKAFANVDQASANLQLLRENVLPRLQDSVELSESSYRGGGDSYFLVLQSTSQFIDSRVRELELETDLRRAIAELERSVGRRLNSSAELPGEELPSLNEAPDLESLPIPELLPAIPEGQSPNSVRAKDTSSVTVIVIQSNSEDGELEPERIAESLRVAAQRFQRSESKRRNADAIPAEFQPIDEWCGLFEDSSE